jgi:hypothetical protein
MLEAIGMRHRNLQPHQDEARYEHDGPLKGLSTIRNAPGISLVGLRRSLVRYPALVQALAANEPRPIYEHGKSILHGEGADIVIWAQSTELRLSSTLAQTATTG